MELGAKNDMKLVCVKPFWWYELAWNKQAYLCCPGWLPKSIGNSIDADPLMLWNSAEAIKIRQSVIDGSFEYCSPEFCPHLSNKTYPVKYVENDEYVMLQKQATEPRINLPTPEWLNFSYDQSCNLACPSCRNEISMASKEDRVVYDDLSEVTLKSFSDARHLYITGSGDPFASRHFWRLLVSDELLKYPDLSLRLHTNGQLCTPARWDRIRHIEHKISTLEISIDAASSQTYSLNRSPGSWEVLCENMDFIASLRNENRISELQLDFVVQNNNWHEMKEFVEVARKWKADTVYFSALSNWGTFSKREYLERAIHKPSHRNFKKLSNLLRDPIFEDPLVYCGFSEEVRKSSSQLDPHELIETLNIS
ncbi:MAG: hypothetical protein V4732_08015 [Pseudomonadota bacterium]